LLNFTLCRWTALEAIQDQKFTEKSDVWSYAVTIIEMFTFGEVPYRGWLNSYVVEMIMNGYRLPCPPICPPVLYDSVVGPAFAKGPADRPTFAEIRYRTERLVLASKLAGKGTGKSTRDASVASCVCVDIILNQFHTPSLPLPFSMRLPRYSQLR